jgi:hypothetical protein
VYETSRLGDRPCLQASVTAHLVSHAVHRSDHRFRVSHGLGFVKRSTMVKSGDQPSPASSQSFISLKRRKVEDDSRGFGSKKQRTRVRYEDNCRWKSG